MSNISFEELVKEKFEGLSSGQKKVAEYILQNIERASYETLVKIGRESNVSETTVIRLSYALGFTSFSEMQKCIQQQILKGNNNSIYLENSSEPVDESSTYAKIIEQDIKILKDMINHLDSSDLDKVINAIIQADKVLVVGYRSSYPAAQWFSTTLGLLRKNVKSISPNMGIFDDLLSVTKQTVVLAISFPRYTKETYVLTKCAKEQGATIVSVTDNKLSPVGLISNLTLTTDINRDESGYNSISSIISLLNLVVAGVRVKENVQIKARLQKLEEIYSSYQIMFE